MSMQWLGFTAFLFAGFTMLNRIAEGAFINNADVSVMNTLTISHTQSIFGLFNVPVLNPNFFLVGIPRLMQWDYAFFGGNAAILQYLFYTLSAAIAFGLFITIAVGMIQQWFRR